MTGFLIELGVLMSADVLRDLVRRAFPEMRRFRLFKSDRFSMKQMLALALAVTFIVRVCFGIS